MPRSPRCAEGIIPIMIVCSVAMLATRLVEAECDQDCNTVSSGLCQQPSSESCPYCVGVQSCSDWTGRKMYTGFPTYGSVLGSKTIANILVACKITAPCVSDGFIPTFYCSLPDHCHNGILGNNCERCVIDDPTTVYAYSCGITDNCYGGGHGGTP